MASASGKKSGPPRIALDSTQAARRSLARLARMRFRGELDSETFRDLIYGLSALLAFDRHLADLRIEERLANVEALLENPPARPYLAPARNFNEAARQAPRQALVDSHPDPAFPDAIAAQEEAIAAPPADAGRLKL